MGTGSTFPDTGLVSHIVRSTWPRASVDDVRCFFRGNFSAQALAYFGICLRAPCSEK